MADIQVNVGDLIDAGCHGSLYVVLVVSGGYWVSYDKADIQTGRGRFLAAGFVRDVVKQ